MPPGARRYALIAAVVIALAGAGAVTYSLLSRATPPVAPAESSAVITREDPAVQSTVTQALTAFQAGDYAGAMRYADSVLLQIPDHTEARRIADRSREALDTINRGLRDARTHFEAGRFDEAAAAAGGVLAVSPANTDAKRIMAESSDRSRGRAVDDARSRMLQARSAAIAAGAQTLAARSFGVAVGAEREAARLQRLGRASDAAAKYYESGGLFRSAEVAAQTASAVGSQRANERPAPATQPSPPVTTPAAEPPPALPTIPVTPLERTPTTPAGPLPLPPASAPAPPSAPAATPPAQPAPDPAVAAAAAAAAAQNAIREVLSRYEQALESRSIEALKRIWPSLGGTQQTTIRTGFEHASRIEVDIVDPRITVSGATATVTFLRHYEVLTDDRQLQRADRNTTMTLIRTDGGWVIEQIRFGPVR
jgi:tetratricopeptide (TPR) repeat protein